MHAACTTRLRVTPLICVNPTSGRLRHDATLRDVPRVPHFSSLLPMDYQELIFDPQVIRRFDVNRSKVYVLSDCRSFCRSFGADDYVRWLGQRTVAV